MHYCIIRINCGRKFIRIRDPAVLARKRLTQLSDNPRCISKTFMIDRQNERGEKEGWEIHNGVFLKQSGTSLFFPHSPVFLT